MLMLNNCWKQKAKIKFSKLEKILVNVRCHGILTLLWVNWCARKEYWAVATARDAHERWVGGVESANRSWKPSGSESTEEDVDTPLPSSFLRPHQPIKPNLTISKKNHKSHAIFLSFFFFKYFLLFSSKSRVNSAHHITAFFTRPWCAVFYLTIFLAFLLIYMLL